MPNGQAYSFELNPELLDMLHKEFNVEGIVSRFSDAIKGKSLEETKKIGEEIFAEYGTEWIRRTLQLGEEYSDRTYEIIQQAVDKTGGYYRFALVPQRFLEIAYLAIQEFSALPVVENNAGKLVYKIADCLMYKKLKETCADEVVKLLPCKEACLRACRVLHQDLDLDALVGMQADMIKDGYCEFYAKRA